MQVVGACRADERLKPLLKSSGSSSAAKDRISSPVLFMHISKFGMTLTRSAVLLKISLIYTCGFLEFLLMDSCKRVTAYESGYVRADLPILIREPVREGNFIIQPKVDFDISVSTVAGLLNLGYQAVAYIEASIYISRWEASSVDHGDVPVQDPGKPTVGGLDLLH
ncbi:hypothetical protein NL676_024470 [Syzygium grande]|nr:hypothetical protein NL676_024470 [Syzygium grande]